MESALEELLSGNVTLDDTPHTSLTHDAVPMEVGAETYNPMYDNPAYQTG